MKDTESLIKKLKIVLIALLIAGILYPIAIHVLFKFKSNCYWITAEWKIGDILGYGGAVLAAIGTSVLGLITLVNEKRVEENALLLKWHPQIEVSRIEVNQSIIELANSYDSSTSFAHSLAVKRHCFDSSSKVKCREFHITCKNVHGIEPSSVKLVSDHCNISFNNGSRRGNSLAKYMASFVADNNEFLFCNCQSLGIISDEYISIDASNNLGFKFSVIVLYDENDSEFIEDVNDSISKNMYGLTLTLRFRNSLGYFEEGVYTFLSSGEKSAFNKARAYFGQEAICQNKRQKVRGLR